MKIKRNIDGKEIEIELTKDEIEKAYRIRDLYYYMEDVRGKVIERYEDDETGCLYSHAAVKQIAELAMRIREWNDSYWEGYWSNINTAIDEYVEHKAGFIKEGK